MQLDFGMKAFADDGLDAGVLDRVLVDRERCAVTHLVIRSPGASEDVLVSIDLVLGTLDGNLRLRPGRDELLHMLPRYFEGRTSASVAGRVDTTLVPERALGLTSETVEIGPDTRIMTADEEEVELAGVGSEEPGNGISRLHARGPGGGDTLIPAEVIAEIREDVVAIRATRDDVLRMHHPPQEPQEERR